MSDLRRVVEAVADLATEVYYLGAEYAKSPSVIDGAKSIADSMRALVAGEPGPQHVTMTSDLKQIAEAVEALCWVQWATNRGNWADRAEAMRALVAGEPGPQHVTMNSDLHSWLQRLDRHLAWHAEQGAKPEVDTEGRLIGPDPTEEMLSRERGNLEAIIEMAKGGDADDPAPAPPEGECPLADEMERHAIDSHEGVPIRWTGYGGIIRGWVERVRATDELLRRAQRERAQEADDLEEQRNAAQLDFEEEQAARQNAEKRVAELEARLDERTIQRDGWTDRYAELDARFAERTRQRDEWNERCVELEALLARAREFAIQYRTVHSWLMVCDAVGDLDIGSDVRAAANCCTELASAIEAAEPPAAPRPSLPPFPTDGDTTESWPRFLREAADRLSASGCTQSAAELDRLADWCETCEPPAPQGIAVPGWTHKQSPAEWLRTWMAGQGYMLPDTWDLFGLIARALDGADAQKENPDGTLPG
jgi:hypothetical protein